MADSRKMEFIVVRYAPPFGMINIGVVLFERTDNKFSFAKIRFTRNLQRICAFDENADIELLSVLFSDLERDINSDPGQMGPFLKMQGTWSNWIQFADPKGVILLGDLDSEFDGLVSRHLPPDLD